MCICDMEDGDFSHKLSNHTLMDSDGKRSTISTIK